MFRELHHVGYLVENLDEAIAFYQSSFGAQLYGRGRLEGRKTNAAFVQIGPSTMVELMEPDDKSALRGQKGLVFHHVGYLVPDIKAAMDELKAKGFKFADDPPFLNFLGWRIAYMETASTQGTRMHLMEI